MDVKPFWFLLSKPAPKPERVFTEAEVVKILVDEKHEADRQFVDGCIGIGGHLDYIYAIRLLAERFGLERAYDAARENSTPTGATEIQNRED